jgi:hypothetical protein
LESCGEKRRAKLLMLMLVQQPNDAYSLVSFFFTQTNGVPGMQLAALSSAPRCMFLQFLSQPELALHVIDFD